MIKKDTFVKSRHSGGSVRPTVGLSGIGCFCKALEKKDSGQAGMPVLRHYRTIYESVKERLA
jgi:hypothetical protein